MKYLIFLLLLFGCGSVNEIDKIPEIPFVKVSYEYQTRDIYYGIYEEIDNGWLFKSHIIDYPFCERAEKPSYCRKIGALFEYDPSHVPGLETKYSFDYTVTQYNMIDPPYFNIIWQDWHDIDPNDNGGNHPISNLKLKVFDGKLHIATYNNAWQWDYDFYNPYDPTDPEDTQHLHPENELTGMIGISIGKKYHIEIIVKDGINPEDGETIIFINGRLLSYESYQTKPLTSIRDAALQFGLYTDRYYNSNINYCSEATGLPENECKSNQVTVKNFEVFERINL